MPDIGGKWTCGVGGNGMMPLALGVAAGYDDGENAGESAGESAGVPRALGAPDGTWGQEPYACAWERYARGRDEDLREGRGSG